MNEDALHAILRRLGVDPPAPMLDRTLVARLLGMRLDEFAREGQPLEIRVPWWPETLFFVPTERDLEALRREGIATYRVWTAHELTALLGGASMTPDALRIVMVARQEFAGEVVEVRRR